MTRPRSFRRASGGGRGAAPAALKAVRVARHAAGRWLRESDLAAVEEPLEIRLDGEPFAVVMRTPGDDEDLIAGFLLAEGAVRGPDDIRHLASRCDRPAASAGCNRIDVALAAGAGAPLARRIVTSSSCGLCGRQTIESLRVEAPRVDVSFTVPREVLTALPAALAAHQSGFAASGGLHAAALFDAAGGVQAVAEDVGRHNAVDKVVGRMLRAGRLPLSASLLFVSGRASFEIVQKAFLAGVPVVGAVSAPTSLAVELAEATGIALAGFVRGGACNVYAHPDRIA